MGRRSYAMRRYRSRRLSKHEADVMPMQLLLLVLGPVTCGISWIGVVALAFADRGPTPRHKGLRHAFGLPARKPNN